MSTVTEPAAGGGQLGREGPGEGHRRGALGLAAGLLLAVALVAVVGPFLWVVLASLKTGVALNDPTAVLFSPTGANWSQVLGGGVLPAAARSAFVGVVAVAISVLVGSCGAYAIARFRAGGSAARFGILAAQVLPPAVLVFPFLTVAFALRLNDTLFAVLIAHLSFVLPVVTWFLVGFFDAVPRELEEQARVDGLGRFAAFRSVVLPQVLPGIGAAAIFGFALSWNDLFYAIILAPGAAATLPVQIAGFNTFRGVDLGAMCAAILVSVVPVVTASFFIQRRLVRGISGGAVKF